MEYIVFKAEPWTPLEKPLERLSEVKGIFSKVSGVTVLRESEIGRMIMIDVKDNDALTEAEKFTPSGWRICLHGSTPHIAAQSSQLPKP